MMGTAQCRGMASSGRQAHHQDRAHGTSWPVWKGKKGARSGTRSSVQTAASVRWDAPPVVVAGAGIAGLATALALHKVGIPVRVLEATAPAASASAGGGAAIGLWENAWVALDALGVGDELRAQHLRLNRVELCRDDGRTLRAFSFAETDAGRRAPRTRSSTLPGPGGTAAAAVGAGSEFRGVRRAALLAALEGALPAGVVVRGSRVIGVRNPGNLGRGEWAVAETEDGSQIEAGVLVGCDGVRSPVASALALSIPNYSGYTAYRGVCKLPGGIASIGLPSDTIRQIWGKGVRAGLYPLSSDELYWYTCYNTPENAPWPPTPEAMQDEALESVAGWSWGLEAAIEATPPEAVSRSRIVDRWTTGPFGRGLTTLCGDAAHPMTPNLGQGGCTALEDAVVLARSLAVGGPTEAVLREYERLRASRCLPLTMRSYAMGTLLQLPQDQVCAVRDMVVSKAFSPGHFLDHTTYDCGTLPI